MTAKDIEASELATLMKDGKALLIDVREPNEYAKEHIEGAESFPLSGFNPLALPEPGGRELVFYCAGGIRSAQAVDACGKAGIAYRAHLKGGINAWRARGLPTVK
jgi:rhodanese-related sulfurtransferase